MALAFEEYINQPIAERIVLVTITKNGVTYCLSDKPYVAEPDDGLANPFFYSIISPAGLPRLKWSVPDFVNGSTTKNYGTLKLTDYRMPDGTDLRAIDMRGASVEIRMAAPRTLYPYSDSVVLFTGEVTDVSGENTTLSYVISEKKADTDKLKLPINRFDQSQESLDFPAENDARFKPLAFGWTNNITAVLVDGNLRVYQVHDIDEFALQDISAVYDNGVSVTYTKNLATGEFTLTNPPAGQITADLEGALHPVNPWPAVSELVLSLLLETYVGLPNIQHDISITGAEFNINIGIYLTDSIDLKSLFTKICRAKIAWWLYDRNGDFRARNYSAPDTTAVQYYVGPEIIKSKWSEDPLRVWRVVIKYNHNFTILSNPASSLSIADQEKLRADYLFKVYEDATIKANYPDALEFELETYYFSSPALSYSDLANKIFTLWGVKRTKATVEVPLKLPLVKLGDTIELNHNDSFYNGYWIVIGITDNIGGKMPTQTLEIWR